MDLLPDDRDESARAENARRRNRVEKHMVDAYNEESSDAIVDILADVMHWLHVNEPDESFDSLVQQAREHFLLELQYEKDAV